jgi:hypothetical protein
MNLVPSLSMRKPRFFLLLPFVLLLLQFGIALLHHHHDSSWYDHEDPIHYLSSNSPIISKSHPNPVRQAFFVHLLPVAKPASVEVSVAAAIIHAEELPLVPGLYTPATAFPKRAPPV